MNILNIYKSMEYGPASENKTTAEEWIKQRYKFGIFINGRWQSPASDVYIDTINPADGKRLAGIALANKEDVDAAVNSAKKALPAWVKAGPDGRAKYLYAIARQIQKHSRLLSVIESLDNGKPIRESRDIDIPLVARHFYHHAGWAQLMPTELKGYREVGVVGQIIPWNFPLLMLAWKIAPALAMGNTVVLKPAEFTSLTALLFAEICNLAGLPPGVVNIITGDGNTGALITEHPEIDKIAFTGSTEVGRIIRRITAGTGKKLSLELGGKSPFIVFEDADLDSVVEGIVDAIWFNQGQVCCAGSRLLVQESVADRLHKKLKARMEKLRIGDSMDKTIDMGAIVAPVQLKTIEKLVKKGIEEGATIWQPTWECPEKGCFYPPTLFTDVSPSNTIAIEEIFGPVLVSMTFRTHTEAIKLANNTRYGLAASIWTENINLALEVAPKVKAGSVWINCSNVFDAAAGFGGYRESGFGREGGKEGLYEYVKPITEDKLSEQPVSPSPRLISRKPFAAHPGIDRTYKHYIGGKQVRPDSGYSMPIQDHAGRHIAEVADGNSKDVRNAVEAAHAASGWASWTGHARAQVLYYLAENLSQRSLEFMELIELSTGVGKAAAQKEFDTTLHRLFFYAAYTDKYDGRIHNTISNNITMAMPEPVGVMAIVSPEEFSLLGFISTVIPPIAMGNRVVAVPSTALPLPALSLYQVLETSDLPGGVINIISGNQDLLLNSLSSHDDIDGIWYFGKMQGSYTIESAAADNMKRTWVNYGKYRNWLDNEQGEGEEFLRHATEIKNIWIPYGA